MVSAATSAVDLLQLQVLAFVSVALATVHPLLASPIRTARIACKVVVSTSRAADLRGALPKTESGLWSAFGFALAHRAWPLSRQVSQPHSASSRARRRLQAIWDPVGRASPHMDLRPGSRRRPAGHLESTTRWSGKSAHGTVGNSVPLRAHDLDTAGDTGVEAHTHTHTPASGCTTHDGHETSHTAQRALAANLRRHCRLISRRASTLPRRMPLTWRTESLWPQRLGLGRRRSRAATAEQPPLQYA